MEESSRNLATKRFSCASAQSLVLHSLIVCIHTAATTRFVLALDHAVRLLTCTHFVAHLCYKRVCGERDLRRWSLANAERMLLLSAVACVMCLRCGSGMAEQKSCEVCYSLSHCRQIWERYGLAETSLLYIKSVYISWGPTFIQSTFTTLDRAL